MTTLRLSGCRSDSLLGYLKALGIHRIVATQADPSVRGSWDGAVFVLDSKLSEPELSAFLLATYAPTPVLNPWNNGAGFDAEIDTAGETMRRIMRTKGDRWKPYREALRFIETHYLATGARKQYLEASDKGGFVRDLRAHCPETMLPWLDAAVVVTSEKLAFPYLLGSGGNDGRLDFAVNFAARALDVCGDESLRDAGRLLGDALVETALTPLIRDAAIGQFSSRHAGGTNATSGFTTGSLVNPWDYILMLEGALLFTGAIGRRTDRSIGRPVFPFALNRVVGGYGSASDDEEDRGELWLPIWYGQASLTSVADLLRKGRIDLPSEGERSVVRAAAKASEAAVSVVTMGVALGIRRLERIAFVQRNGLAYSATAIGDIRVDDTYDFGIAVISERIGMWIDRVRRLSHLGAAAREALRSFDDRLFGFANLPKPKRARARQDLLVAVADIDRAIARLGDETLEVPSLDADVLASLDDGSPEHDTALAVASLGARHEKTRTKRELRRAGDDAMRTLRELIERRIRNAEKDSEEGWLDASYTISANDVVAFLAFDAEQQARFNRLLRAYSLVRLRNATGRSMSSSEIEALPAAYGVLKLVFDNQDARDERIVRLLFAGDTARALALAYQRARTIRGLPFGPRDVSTVRLEDTRWAAAALALPLSHVDYIKLWNAALTSRTDLADPAQADMYTTYLKQLTGKESST